MGYIQVFDWRGGREGIRTRIANTNHTIVNDKLQLKLVDKNL